jgi:hypothetical protein
MGSTLRMTNFKIFQDFGQNSRFNFSQSEFVWEVPLGCFGSWIPK